MSDEPSLAAQTAQLTQRVRHGDRDRFLTGLFAPPEKRHALFAIYALEFELARIPELVSEPMLGEIRLQWWRELVDAIASGHGQQMHPLSAPLIDAIAGGFVPRAGFDRLIDSFSDNFSAAADGEAASTPFPGLAASLDLAAVLLADALAMEGELLAGVAALSEGYQLILQILSLSDQRSGGQTSRIAPVWLADHGLRRAGLRADDNRDAVRHMTKAMADRARDRLRHAAADPLFSQSEMRPLGWLIVLCAGYLNLLRRGKFDPFAKSMQVPVYRRQFWLMRAMLRRGALSHGL